MRGIDVDKLWPEVRVAGERIVIGILILIAFWIVARVAEFLVCRVRRRMPHNTAVLQLLGRMAKIAIMLFGVATALGTMGVNVSALVAGLGLTGFALGFAFHDVLSNLLAGILLLLFRPFDVGDAISTAGLDGRVTQIDLRYTMLQQETKRILIPNSNLFTNPIVVTLKNPSVTSSNGGQPAAIRADLSGTTRA